MTTNQDLRDKCEELNQVTERDPHKSESYYVAHLYWRSDRPYILGCNGTHIARGTKSQLIDAMDLIIMGYRLAQYNRESTTQES